MRRALKLPLFKGQLPSLDCREIENVVDNAQQPSAQRTHQFDIPAGSSIRCVSSNRLFHANESRSSASGSRGSRWQENRLFNSAAFLR